MNIININQNTDEWLIWRNTGLGASDAATILGKNPYQTAFDLWEVMTNRKKPLDLSNKEKRDLIAFLKSLTDESFIQNSLFQN